MPVNIIVFGQLADVTGSSLSLDDITDTDNLLRQLNKRYPELADKKYVVAVDKRVVTSNTVLTNNNTVALLPPFSGG
ncbi:MAG TPA: MoaD/ThiS family protein [Chitinophagaceae bacterium]|nr:MoaD/ThiS family protein [Chitinophagaceae bacterium]